MSLYAFSISHCASTPGAGLFDLRYQPLTRRDFQFAQHHKVADYHERVVAGSRPRLVELSSRLRRLCDSPDGFFSRFETVFQRVLVGSVETDLDVLLIKESVPHVVGALQ